MSGDKLVAYRYRAPPADPKTNRIDKSRITNHLNAWRLTESGIEHLWEDGDLPPDEGPHLAIARGVVYGFGQHRIRCLDLETGKVLGEINEEQFPHPEGQLGDVPRSNPLLVVTGDKLIISPEGQHGKHGFVLFDSEETHPAGRPAAQMVSPSRINNSLRSTADRKPHRRWPDVFRGGNGIYCYDLRKRK